MKLVKDVLRKQKRKKKRRTDSIYGVTSLPKEKNYKKYENLHINTLLK